MSQPVTTVSNHRLWMWCPGCDDPHAIVFETDPDEPGPVWDWDGDRDNPTVTPSILVNGAGLAQYVADRCHSFLRAGRWEFLADCTHDLAGQIVDMVPIPDWLLSNEENNHG